ncbi:MAG TPA: SDR family oxidoreductase [Streptosporangiaceae bacterium]|nr:SDR family oxidoreductase [Streptosporangiaceae bacterium]
MVTGASGYIGGRLVPELLAAGYPVRCMARDPGKLSGRPWSGDVGIAVADALDRPAVRQGFEGVDVAYYLIHSLGTGASFEQRDREAAAIFADAAMSAGVKRIVYLGGIVSGARGGLSPHLRSRAEVGDILLGSGVPAAALQAAVIIGSGSASFEMLRYLTERLPVMVTPTWTGTRIQPIAARDVLRYLVGCAALPPDVNRRFDIGGPDVLTYAEMMRRYSQVAGLRPRVLIPVPLLTPRLSSLWVGLVTPVPAGLAVPLVESLRNEVVCSEHDIASYVPDPPEGLVPVDRAIALALRHTRDGAVSTRWSSAATPGVPSDPLPSDPPWAGGSLYVDARSSAVRASPAALWRVIESIGGQTGWYSFPAAWAVRGLLDRLGGGVGLRRGRRDPRHLRVGDPLDFWRVEAITPGSLLRLRAKMKLPGLAWLELAAGPEHDGLTTYSQRAIFQPRGLAGHAYWRSMTPFHSLVFGGMVRNITAAAERAARRTSPHQPRTEQRGKNNSWLRT